MFLQTCVVGTLNDLFNIKPYQVTVIFVDSNDRDVILENPETDIGDIRRKTTECLMKINCKSYKQYVHNEINEENNTSKPFSVAEY